MISFLGVRTDRDDFGILVWKHVGTQKISNQNSKFGISCRLSIANLYASPDDEDSKLQTIIWSTTEEGLFPAILIFLNHGKIQMKISI